QIRHGGGRVLPKNSEDYNTVLDWIRAGAPSSPTNERRMVSLRVTPNETVLYGRNAHRHLLVTARYSDGTEGDVTKIVKFQSNDDALVSVNQQGILTGLRGGETAIVVRGPGVVTATKVGVVIGNNITPAFPSNNFIDDLVFAKLKKLRIPPSDLADDATYLRRVYLDVIGLIPTSAEARHFLADNDPNKR